MAGQRFTYCWFLRIEVPHLIGMISENQVGIAERVRRTRSKVMRLQGIVIGRALKVPVNTNQAL
jgi:hypothetical protein